MGCDENCENVLEFMKMEQNLRFRCPMTTRSLSLLLLTRCTSGLFADWGLEWLPFLIHVSEYLKFLEALKIDRAIGA